MRPETLTSLAIDRELGELPPEVAELFDAYAQEYPGARLEASAMGETIRVARDAVRLRADPAPVADVRHGRPRPGRRLLWVAQAAAAMVALGLGIWIGRETARERTATVARNPPVRPDAGSRAEEGLWVRYQVAYDGLRGAYTVAPHP